MAAKSKSKARKGKQADAPAYTDVSEGWFTVPILGRGAVSLPETWTRTYHACGTVHSIFNELILRRVFADECGSGITVRVKYVTFDSTSETPDVPTTTEITDTMPDLGGDGTTVMVVSKGSVELERTEGRRVGEEDRLLVRRVSRGCFEDTWTYFDEPQGSFLRVKSHCWREVDKDGKEIRHCQEVEDGLVLHPPKFRVAQAGGDVRRPKDAKGKPVRQAPGLRVDLIPNEDASAKKKRAGKKDGRRTAGRVRKGRGRGDRVPA